MLDASFGIGGVVIHEFDAGVTQSSAGFGAATTPDGQLVSAGGGATTAPNGTQVFVARTLLDTPPSVSVSSTPGSPLIGQPVTFTARASDDTTVTGLAWDLGSGGFSDGSGASASRTFASPGVYTVRVKATDDDGLSTIASATVTVASPPSGARPIVPRLTVGRLRGSGGAVSFSIACRAPSAVVCHGAARLTTLEHLLGSRLLAVSARARRHTSRTLIGQVASAVRGGATRTISIALNATGRRLLARFHRVPATLTIALNGARGFAANAKVTVTPKQRRPKRRRRR
jgi:PKD domain